MWSERQPIDSRDESSRRVASCRVATTRRSTTQEACRGAPAHTIHTHTLRLLATTPTRSARPCIAVAIPRRRRRDRAARATPRARAQPRPTASTAVHAARRRDASSDGSRGDTRRRTEPPTVDKPQPPLMMTPNRSPNRNRPPRQLASTGDYGDPPKGATFAAQLGAWLTCLAINKVGSRVLPLRAPGGRRRNTTCHPPARFAALESIERSISEDEE